MCARYLLHFLLLSGVMMGQSLVTNGSFETYSTCPSSAAQISYATGWYSACATPDYFNACGTGIVDVPANWCGTQSARTGNAYGRILDYGYSVNYREYMQTQLSSTLVAGSTYLIQYYVSLCDNQQIAHNGPEGYISTTAISTGTVFTMAPHIYNTTAITDKTNWVLVQGYYTAAGGERYLTLGQFQDDSYLSPVTGLGGTWASTSYYIDDVSLVLSTPLMQDLEHIHAYVAGSDNVVEIHMAPRIDGKIILERSTDGMNWSIRDDQLIRPGTEDYSFLDHDPRISVWYRVRIEDPQGQSGYSEVVQVHRTAVSGVIAVYPVPVGTGAGLHLCLPGSETAVSLRLVSAIGQEWKPDAAQVMGKSEIEINCDALRPGIWHIEVQTETNTYIEKVLVTE